jgi:hypothetical protein
MPDPVPNAELLRSLGRLVRGLSALFWGLPIGLLVCFHTAKAEVLRSFGVVPPIISTGLLVFGLWQLSDFQKQERIWRHALDRAGILSLLLFFLSPFFYFSNKMPDNAFFMLMVIVGAVAGLLLLGSLNVVLRRLGAMLPDEALRIETKQFTALNLNLLLAASVLVLAYFGLSQLPNLPLWLRVVVAVIDRGTWWFLIPLLLLPVAMTMALLWKTKEVILDNVFGAER